MKVHMDVGVNASVGNQSGRSKCVRNVHAHQDLREIGGP